MQRNGYTWNGRLYSTQISGTFLLNGIYFVKLWVEIKGKLEVNYVNNNTQ